MAVQEIGLSQADMGVRATAGPIQGNYPITGTMQQRIATVVNARFELARDASRGQFQKFHRYDKIIEMISKKKAYEWKANAYLPYALSTVEQAAAIKFLMLMAGRPRVHVSPRKGSSNEVADHRQNLLEWHFDGDIDLVSLLADALRGCERYGKAVVLVVPDWDQKTLRFREQVNIPTVYGPLARMAWKMAKERAYYIRAENVDLTTLFVEPNRRRINGPQGMRWIIREFPKTIDELREMESLGMWGPQVGGESVDAIMNTNQVEDDEWRWRRQLLLRQSDIGMDRDKFDRTVRIREYQGRVPPELVDPNLAQMELAAGLDPLNRVMAVANGQATGYSQALPWDHGHKSYIEMDCIPSQQDFWGKGKVEPIEHLVYIGNEIVNMRVDNVKAAINGLIGVDGSRMPAGWKKRLISQPFGVHETNGPPNEVIQRLQLGDVTASSYQEQAQIWSLIQLADAVNETMLGAPGGAVRTLGEHQIKEENATKRLMFEVARQAIQFFSSSNRTPGMVHFILSLDRQYMPLGQYISVVKPLAPDSMAEFQIGPQDLSEDIDSFTYTPSGAIEAVESVNKRVEMGQLLQTIAPFAELLLAGGLDIMDMFKQLFRAYRMDTSRLFGPQSMMMQGPGSGGPGMPFAQRQGGGQGPGGRVMPFPGVTGGSLRPEQRAAPGNRPTPPWEGGSRQGGRYEPAAGRS